MVCPDCGSGEFTADHHATIRRTYRVEAGHPREIEEKVIDVDRDFDTLTCADCGSECWLTELITEAAYEAGEDAHDH